MNHDSSAFQDENLVFVRRNNEKEFTFGKFESELSRGSLVNDETWENKKTVPPSNFARLVQLTPFKKKVSSMNSSGKTNI